jgi:hypothetical protein
LIRPTSSAGALRLAVAWLRWCAKFKCHERFAREHEHMLGLMDDVLVASLQRDAQGPRRHIRVHRAAQ